MGNIRDKTIALAGIFQAVALVKQIATKGIVDVHDMDTCVRSIFETNPESTEAIYGKLDNLRSGLQMLVEQLGNSAAQRDMDIARYAITLLHLQRKLSRNAQLMNTLSDGIERARRQSEHFSLTHENVIANLAGLYSETVSLIPPKIMVSGESHFLSNTDNANKIRAVLLAGMRAAVLWRQLGGNRWQILWSRKKFIRQAEHMLHKEIPRVIN